MRPTSAMALTSSDCFEPACRVRTRSEAFTLVSLREPATRRTSSQLFEIRSTLILFLRERPSRGP